jgi:hypothetical protein
MPSWGGAGNRDILTFLVRCPAEAMQVRHLLPSIASGEAQSYKPEGRGFDSQWNNWI